MRPPVTRAAPETGWDARGVARLRQRLRTLVARNAKPNHPGSHAVAETSVLAAPPASRAPLIPIGGYTHEWQRGWSDAAT